MKKELFSLFFAAISVFGFAQDPENNSFKVMNAPLSGMGNNDDQYITLNNSGTLQTSDFFTIEAWIKLPSSATSSDVFNIYEVYGNNSGWGGIKLRIENLSVKTSVLGQSGGIGITGSHYLTPGQWHHVAFTYNDLTGDQFAYLDGVQTGSVPNWSVNYYSLYSTVRIGADGNNDNVPNTDVDFLIDEIRFWSVDKNQQEISDGMFACDYPYNEPNLVLNYTFNEQSAFDYAYGLGTNNGTINNVTNDLWDIGAYCCGFDALLSGFGSTYSSLTDNAVYQWINCDNGNAAIVGEINQSFTPITAGNYACVVNKFDCSDTTDCVNIDPTSSTDGKKGLQFNGVDELINIGSPLQFASEMTIEAWINPSANNYRRLFTKFPGTGAPNGLIIIDTYNATDNGQNLRLYIKTDIETINLQAPNVLALNTWQHVAFTFNGNDQTAKIYVDGINVATATHTSSNMAIYGQNWGIGEDHNGAGAPEYFQGSMDDIRFWNRAKSQSQIADSMNVCLSGSENDLMLYYNFENASANSIPDESGNGFTGGWIGSGSMQLIQSELECTNNSSKIEDTQMNNVQVSPNPASTLIRINSDAPIKDVTVFNSVGQLVIQTVNNQISIEDLPNGIYIVNITTINGLFQSKIVKQ